METALSVIAGIALAPAGALLGLVVVGIVSTLVCAVIIKILDWIL